MYDFQDPASGTTVEWILRVTDDKIGRPVEKKMLIEFVDTLPQPDTGLTVSAPAVQSTSQYSWEEDLDMGDLVYTDRVYQITGYPAELGGAFLLKTANDNK